jgi:preprotein translocase subunit SecD
MLHFPKWKVILTVSICLLATLMVIPNFIPDAKKHLGSFGEYTMNPGLDLKGGSYLLLEVDFDTYFKEQIENLRDELRLAFQGKMIGDKRIRYPGGMQIQNTAISLTIDDPTIVQDAASIIRKTSTDLDVTVNDSTLTVKYKDPVVEAMRQQVLSQSVEIVRRRIDEVGTRELDIQRQGDNRILLQVPGLQDPEYLKQLLGKTAKMTFHLLNDSMPYPDTTKLPVPPGAARLRSDASDTYYTINKRIIISGDLLSDARAGFNQNGEPIVNIHFNSLGAKKFGDVTKNNVGKPFAIVLDNKVLTAPVIRSVILDGRAEISGNFSNQETTELSLLLRAGALPAPVKVVEERTVGPSLGADSIAAGRNASIVGAILVVSFMMIVYGFFGFLANLALVFNVIITLAILSLFQATLTLPGIAGIVLSMGMAVDANVLIFERIREELRLGKTVIAALDNGYKKAFGTIVDSHITTLTASIILFFFGSGAVKGFAVTLFIGILTSMFTAVVLTRLFTVIWFRRTKPKTISI